MFHQFFENSECENYLFLENMFVNLQHITPNLIS